MKKIFFIANDPNQDNHSNQLNPNNDAYWQSREDFEERPAEWEEISNVKNSENE